MAYYSEEKLSNLGFKSIGSNVKVSDKACIYNADLIEIGDNSRIDDFCIVSGKVIIGRNVHITPQCLVAGGKPGIVIGDFVALAYGVKVFAQSDDYSGETMTNSTVPKAYKNEVFKSIKVGRQSIIGANSVIMPGANIGEGNAIGANSLVTSNTQDWSIYVGSPAKKLKDRKRDLLKLERHYLESEE